jgi:hypothetical protein
VVALAAAAAFLAACVTTNPPHNLNVEDVRALRLERVDVVIDPAAPINWADLENEYIEKRGEAAKSSQASRERETKAARDFAAARIRDRARSVVEPALKSALDGRRPVTARIIVHRIGIPTTFQVVVGGLFSCALERPGTCRTGADSVMNVAVDFIDTRTGAVVLSYPRTVLTTQGGQKINMGTTGVFSHDPIERMLADLNGRLTSWLLKA